MFRIILSGLFQYQAFDIITLEKLFEREYAIRDAQRPDEIVSYYAKLIASNLKLPSQFNALARKCGNSLKNALSARESIWIALLSSRL
jgi:type III restriction enzyme